MQEPRCQIDHKNNDTTAACPINTPGTQAAPFGPNSSLEARVVRVAILSDLHMFSQSDPGRKEKRRETPSYLCTDAGHQGTLGDPLADLKRLIADGAHETDMLLCAGDLADIGSETGMREGWKHVNDIAEALGALCVVGTPGNHDIRSDDPEPDGYLKALKDYPVADRNLRNQFWTDHFTLLEEAAYRLIVLNSCAYLDARENGRFETRARKALDKVLASLTRKSIQILLCHHHPHQHSEYQLGEHDVMRGGQLLLDMLGRYGNWLVVHGHKHHPKLSRAAGHNSAPWVLAAGSFAALPNPVLQGHARNQFYILEFEPSTFSSLGWGGYGQAWDWATGDGWVPAGKGSGLPARFGFGYAGDLELLAQSIRSHVPENTKSYVEWAELCSVLPHLNRLTPRDIEELANLGLSIEPHDDGVPFQVSRLP